MFAGCFQARPIVEDKVDKSLPKSKSHATPVFEQFKGTRSQMDVQGDVSTAVSLKRMPITENHNHSSCNISCGLFPKNVNNEVPSSAPGISQCVEMIKTNGARTITVPRATDLGYEGDNISCISKADGTNLELSNHRGDIDQKNLTGSSTSVTSFCQEGSEKPVDVLSMNNGCIGNECIAEEGNKFRGSPEVARETLQSAADLSDKSDPSETSSLRDEQGPVSPKVESFSPARGTALVQKCSNGFTDNCKSNGEICSNRASTDVLNKLDQKQHSEMKITHDIQKPNLLYRAMGDNEDPDELIDVRVCDICGDVGREALLAVCSKCCDGAEHIYCMRNKMDKVPGSEWMCEDCTVTAESQNNKAEEHKIGRALQKSSTYVAQNSRRLDLGGDDGRFKTAHPSLASSRKRPGLSVDVNISSKRRALDNAAQLSSPRSFLKAVSPRHSNLKFPNKGEVASPSGRSSLQNVSRKAYELLPGRSPRIESQLHKGSFSKQKNIHSPRVRIDRESEDVQRRQKTVEGSSAFGAGQHHALTKLKKSKSFTPSSIVRLDRNESKKIMENDFKIPKVGSQRSITQRSYSFNSKIPQSSFPNTNSSISIVKPAKATPSPVDVKQRVVQNSHPAAKSPDVRKELEKAAIHRAAKRQCDSNGSGLNRKISSSLASNGRSLGTSGRSSSVSLGQKADRNFTNVESEQKLKGVKHEMNGTKKVQLNCPPSRATATLPVSAHPDADCVWRGMFNLDCNKLPICCSGLQAHLSTCASPKAFEVASKLPGEITVQEVLQQDIWPVQFNQNHVTENDIALYFFAEDNESYRRYKRFLNCMLVNDLALIAHLEGAELLIFHSQVLPEKSQRWNNLFFLWGVFRANQSSYPDDVCVPSPRKSIQIPTSDVATPPQDPPLPIHIISSPKNSSVSTQADPGVSVAEAVSKPVIQSQNSTKSSENEVDMKTVETTLVEKEQHLEEAQSINEGQVRLLSVAEAVSKSVIQSQNSTKSYDNEADMKTLETTLIEREQHLEEAQSTNEAQNEDTSPCQASEVKPVEKVVTGIPPELKPTYKEVTGIPPEVKPTYKEVTGIAPEVRPIDEEVIGTAPEVKPIDEEVIGIAPEVKPMDEEVIGTAPEVKPIDEEVTEIAPEVNPIDEEVTGAQRKSEIPNIDVNLPAEANNGFQGFDDMNGRSISLNSSPSTSCDTRTSGKAMVSIPLDKNGSNGRTISLNSSPSNSEAMVPIPVDKNGYQENRKAISLNSSPSNSGGTECQRDFNLELPLLAENEVDFVPVNGNANVRDNGFVSLDLSLALPSTDTNPVPMMEDPIPEMDDDVDTSLCLFFGGKKA